MSITNRISRIAKSYIESAKESFSDEFEDISAKYSNSSIRELGEELLQRLEGLTGERYPGRDREMSEDEIDRLLNEDLPETQNGYQQQRQQKSRSRSSESTLKESLKRLGLPPGATLAEAEKAYKKEIRKYHPDHFVSDPKKAQVATKVAQMLGEALENVRKHKK
jgi:hypothetical protein